MAVLVVAVVLAVSTWAVADEAADLPSMLKLVRGHCVRRTASEHNCVGKVASAGEVASASTVCGGAAATATAALWDGHAPPAGVLWLKRHLSPMALPCRKNLHCCAIVLGQPTLV